MNPNSPVKSWFLRIRQTWFSDRNIYLLIVGLGITLRLVQYLYNRSLWGDEARLALGIIDFNVSIFKPLPHFQVAPVLFLMIERFFVFLFGNNELSLRAFPLVCSIATLPLIKIVAKQITKNERIALVSLLLFSVSPLLVFYSSEVKQYSSDVFTFLLLTSITLSNLENKEKIFWLTFAGVITIFLSNIAVLVLFYTNILLFFNQVKKRKIEFYFILSSIILLFFFTVNYYFFIYNHPTHNFMLEFWDFAFMPANPFTLEFWEWLFQVFISFFRKLFFVRFKLPWPVYVFTGIVSIIFISATIKEIKNRNYTFLYLTLLPILLHLVISSFRIYPFDSRLILYLSPVFIIIISTGILRTYNLLKTKKQKSGLSILSILLLFGMLILNRKYFPMEQSEIKQSMNFIKNHYEAGDKIIVSNISSQQFNYYMKTRLYDFEKNSIYYSKDFNEIESQFSDISFNSKSVWFIFSYNSEKNEKEVIQLKDNLMQKGEIINLTEPTGNLTFNIQPK